MKLAGLVVLLAFAGAVAAAQPPPASSTYFPPRYAHKPRIADYYPSVSRSLKEQGTTMLRLCYDQLGRARQVTVSESSGFERLDSAALRWARGVRITPGLFRGKPQPACVRVPARFSLGESGEAPEPGEELLVPEVKAPPAGRFIPLQRETMGSS